MRRCNEVYQSEVRLAIISYAVWMVSTFKTPYVTNPFKRIITNWELVTIVSFHISRKFLLSKMYTNIIVILEVKAYKDRLYNSVYMESYKLLQKWTDAKKNPAVSACDLALLYISMLWMRPLASGLFCSYFQTMSVTFVHT